MVRNCHNRPQVTYYTIMKHFLLHSERTRGKLKESVCHLDGIDHEMDVTSYCQLCYDLRVSFIQCLLNVLFCYVVWIFCPFL